MLDLLARLLTRVTPFRHNDLADLYLERRNIMNVGVIYLNFEIRFYKIIWFYRLLNWENYTLLISLKMVTVLLVTS